MTTAKLNIWVSELDQPCRISNRTWYVTIYGCDGKPLEWCGRRYVVMAARCGHLEVDVPPGCYAINAVWGFRFLGGIYYVNHFTDHAILQASCGQEVCVNLYAPTAHRCGVILLRAVQDLQRQNAIKPDLAKRAQEVLNELVRAIPAPVNEFELGHLDEIDRLVEEQERDSERAQERPAKQASSK
ncbi:MAG: hypothetical protein ACRD5H_13885 [Nitrososphaerales archaeon]